MLFFHYFFPGSGVNETKQKVEEGKRETDGVSLDIDMLDLSLEESDLRLPISMFIILIVFTRQ